MLFPEDDQPGVDLILPDFSSIADRLDDIVAIVLTHGHEDHIGAVPYLLRLRRRHPARRLQADPRLHRGEAQGAPDHARTPSRCEEGQIERFGPFECEFVAVNHSIPDALAVAVRTSAGTVLHTGDFKMDQLPLDGRLTDLRAFARLGEEGVDLFMVDSTNAEVPGFTTSEREIAPVLDRVFAQARRRIIVASFASPRAPRAAGARRRPRRTAARSPSSAARWSATWASPATSATCTVPDGPRSSTSRRSTTCPDDEVVLMCTGSQGEPMAALSRMANRDHR